MILFGDCGPCGPYDATAKIIEKSKTCLIKLYGKNFVSRQKQMNFFGSNESTMEKVFYKYKASPPLLVVITFMKLCGYLLHLLSEK